MILKKAMDVSFSIKTGGSIEIHSIYFNLIWRCFDG